DCLRHHRASHSFPTRRSSDLCFEAGVRVADASVAGLGGCPYANGATGNVATEDVVYLLDGVGARTAVDLGALIEVARWISAEIRSEEHTSELQSLRHLVCRLL